MSLLLPFTLAAILTTDPLGYECVPEDKLEIAFALGGKGTRVPQTCIPDPCAQTFTEATLASYSGYRDTALYDDYRHRMTRICGAPTQWADKGITEAQLLWAVFDGGSGKIPAQKPVQWSYCQGPFISAAVNPVGHDEPSFKPLTWGDPGFDKVCQRDASPGDTDVPTHAPLPSALWLLAAAVAALVLLRRKRASGR